MLKQHSQVVLILMLVADACAVSVAWLLSYYLRFRFLPVDPEKGVPGLAEVFLPLLPLAVVAHLLIFYRVRLYQPRRDGSIRRETRDIVKAFVVAIVAIILIDYAMPRANKVSRQFILTYAIVGTACFAAFRATLRVILRALRRRGFNRRTAAIVGSGRTAQRLLHALRRHGWTGIEVLYFVDDPEPGRPARLRGVPVRGPISDLQRIVAEGPVDSIFVSLPTQQAHRLNEVLSGLDASLADVRLVPEIDPAYVMRPNTSELEGVPILSLRQTPLYGWNALLKRSFDLGVGSACLVAALPLMGVIALVIKLTSPGPVLYRQRRMGFDGREFTIIKFRTMRVDAEAGGPVWSRREDSRRTALGRMLRRTSLDELPNLFNVLAGEMSLVGPRPERPEFIAQFQNEIPRYMLRHKMKAGMTGYAQIKGYRGQTSLKKRIQHDVHYVKHWSLGMDLRILVQTLFGAWFSRHEA
jgi:Undecaprenyl-phosphate glucose phosphotransferase